ncbi:hypothetical protein FQZ97_961040 [compost metagenome]
MKDQRGQAFIAPAHHGVHDRVVEPAQGRIGLHAADGHVHALQALHCRLAASRALAVVAAIGHATGDGEAVVLRFQGKFRGDKHVPDDIGAANVGIQAVTLIIWQVQLLAGERPGLL